MVGSEIFGEEVVGTSVCVVSTGFVGIPDA
jgi:hypothetical protein